MSDTLVTSVAFNLYAFNMVVKIFNVSPDSANPAVASFVELDTKLTASPVFCPAEMALYTSSATFPTAIPVSFDRSIMASFISDTDISFVSMIVDTFAISSSKSTAIFPAATPATVTAADTLDTFFPVFSIFSPAFSHPSANVFHL